MDRIWQAFLNSCAGFSHGVRTERAIRQEIIAIIVTLPAALYLGQTGWQRLALIIAGVISVSIEFLNTCIEKLCDHVTPEKHEQIRIIKDMGSAACFSAQMCTLAIWVFAAVERFR